ncbi:hypothetical protein CYLTODRAFT_376814 [Cylindrobasidium torrendii FP15055 ss-10]|uniref:DUF1793-domain-containing protein n=1 Tax=Cylindrobasidium torrendii FP15055 ss-10 TaxID=1314674 RepID=A0A0D7BA71_9AGAR|nr:hypothetical protein CYLTODRAFT_376814 [Cylindrobasidium torrendii FP15055 ss-10]
MRALSWAVALLPVFSLAQIWPATVPLAVRNPYFNAHMNLAGSTHNDWPQFWNLNHIVAWDLWVMVDGKNMQLFGGAGVRTNLTNIEITPTRSILTIQAGPVDATVTFLNPIVPGDLVAQSLPFTYMYCDITVTDGKDHSIQLYTDVTGEWLSNDVAQGIKWDTFKSASIIYHTVSLQKPEALTEDVDMALDASLYYAFRAGDGVAYRTGDAAVSRPQWVNTTTLNGDEDKNYRNINDAWPCFAFSRDYGTLSDKTETAVWALGLARDPNVAFGTTKRHPFYLSQYKDAPDALTQFLANFENAQSAAVAFDTSFTDSAKKVSDEYAQLVSIGALQALGTMEWTVSQSSDGSWNISDSMAFMKDIGVSTRVNPVDAMSATFPMLLSINATWAGYLLQPLLYSAKHDGSDLKYAMYDLGDDYPTASVQLTPPTDTSIESTGDMLIMTWAQATASGDATYIKSYYSVLKKWADYLISQGTSVSGMVDGDNVSNANLALKGVLGVKCMAAIAKAVGQDADDSVYSANATTLYNSWKENAFKDDHVVSDYSSSSSWGLIYALFYDRFLGLGVVEDEVYSAQDTFYASQLANANKFGVAYDTSVTMASAPWSMLTAAATTDTSVRDKLVSQVYARMSTNASAGVFPSVYDPSKGDTKSGAAGAGIGAMWSLLSLDIDLKTPSGGGALDGSTATTDDQTLDKDSGSSAGPIAGGVVGGLALLGILGAAFFFWRRRKQGNQPVYEARPAREMTPQGSGTPLLPMSLSSSGQRNQPVVSPYHVEPFTMEAATTGGRWSQDGGDRASGMSPSSGTSPKTTMTSPWSAVGGGSSHSGPRSDASSSSGRNTNSQGEPAALHAEVENLRREMEVMRAQVQYSQQDMPPPSYDMERERTESGLSAPGGMSSAVNMGAGTSGQSGRRQLPPPPPPAGAASPYLPEKTGNW